MNKKTKLLAVLFGVLIVLSGLAFYAAYQDMYGNPNSDHGIISQLEEKIGIEPRADEKEADKADKNDGSSGSDASSDAGKSTSSSKQSGSGGQTKQQVCYISIDGYCSNVAVPFYDGDTAYDILARSGAPIRTRNSEFGIYVVGINGREEKDEGASSGWIYTVNGDMPNVSAGSMYVSPGDQIYWQFVNGY